MGLGQEMEYVCSQGEPESKAEGCMEGSGPVWRSFVWKIGLKRGVRTGKSALDGTARI